MVAAVSRQREKVHMTLIKKQSVRLRFQGQGSNADV